MATFGLVDSVNYKLIVNRRPCAKQCFVPKAYGIFRRNIIYSWNIKSCKLKLDTINLSNCREVGYN